MNSKLVQAIASETTVEIRSIIGMKQIDMAKIKVAGLLDFHTGGRHKGTPRSHT